MPAASRLLARLTLAVAALLASPRAHAQGGDVPSQSTPSLPASIDMSGTAWSPPAGRPGAVHRRAGPWALMLHGEGTLQGLAHAGSPHYRGRGISAVNWFMTSADRRTVGGTLVLRAMASAEPWTVRGCGYPDLLATGEVCDGDSMHDRQHPHDLFMELAATYDRPLIGSTRLQVYGGPVGEPALGPAAFMHRTSAAGNPVAPLTHHALDSTHVSFGVLTGAVYGRTWKVDASLFNGREPDDRRLDLERSPLDSWSARITLRPSAGTVLQVSGAQLQEVEAGIGTAPRLDATRVTTSISSVRRIRSGLWAATVAYGFERAPTPDRPDGLRRATHALLAEGTVVNGVHRWFGRIEVAGKPAHDLHADEFSPDVLSMARIQVGYQHHLATLGLLDLSGGATLFAGLVEPRLAPRYEGRVVPGVGILLRLAPPTSITAQAGHAAHESP